MLFSIASWYRRTVSRLIQRLHSPSARLTHSTNLLFIIKPSPSSSSSSSSKTLPSSVCELIRRSTNLLFIIKPSSSKTSLSSVCELIRILTFTSRLVVNYCSPHLNSVAALPCRMSGVRTVRLSTLNQQRADVDRRCDELLSQRTHVQNRLDLLQTTLSQLRTEPAQCTYHRYIHTCLCMLPLPSVGPVLCPVAAR